MSWQKCPICNGIGAVETAPGLQAMTCDVCLGKKIIGPDGQPPKELKPSNQQVPDLAADELMKPMSPFEEISEDEIQYWATPYYDHLQAEKQAKLERIKEEKSIRGERHG